MSPLKIKICARPSVQRNRLATLRRAVLTGLLALHGVQGVAQTSAPQAQEANHGQLVQVCFGCHAQAHSLDQSSSIPPMPVLPATVMYQRLRSLQTTAPPNAGVTTTIMYRLLRGYTDAELQAMAQHLGSNN